MTGVKRIEVFYMDHSVWARGSIYKSVPIVMLKDGEVLFRKFYPRGTSFRKIWDELRERLGYNFYDIFYPSVVWGTARSQKPSDNPEIALRGQTEYLKKRQATLREYYDWNPSFKKWVMSPSGYVERVEKEGGGLSIGVGMLDMKRMEKDFHSLEVMSQMFRGKTKELILFVYPDKYDEEIRAMFLLKIEFWD